MARGLLDTSVVIDLDRIPVEALPTEVAVSAITMAELAADPAAATNDAERARRQDRLHSAVRARGRRSTRRPADLLIAAVAVANGLPVVTRNKRDFTGLEDLLTVVEI